ncbi:MAG: heterodisulfide reductase-related iron-sulfur binding cluster [Firmicutes bacterium]|nr:heterodisulfide reductase-related iron-sulfur binding cluster [Bacillota bacterium]
MIDNTLPEIGKAVVEVLERNGRKVILPREQQCCGTPMYISGDLQTARQVARANVELFNRLDVEAIVVACASCGLALKKEYREFFKDEPAFLPQVEAFSARVRDISEYLVEQALVDPAELGRLPARVTYHDPCHLVRGQGVAAQPRSLLKAIPGVDFVEMAEADRCCGAGGMFQAFYPEIAGPITRRKLGNIAATQAEYVVTGCPACLQRIQGGLDLARMPQKGIHIVELLNMAHQAAENAGEKRARAATGSR